MLSCSLSVGMTIRVSRTMLAGSRAFPAPGAGARWRREFTSYHRLRLPGKARSRRSSGGRLLVGTGREPARATPRVMTRRSKRAKTAPAARDRPSETHGERRAPRCGMTTSPCAGTARPSCTGSGHRAHPAVPARSSRGEGHGKAGDPRLCRARLPGSAAAAHHRQLRGTALAEPRGAAGFTHGRGHQAAPAQPRVRAVRGELGWGAWTLTLLAVLLAVASAAVEPAQAPEQINARDAGARADGVHDDAPALQAALDRLADRGGVLDLPAGTYLVGAPLVMRGDNVVLRGDGATVRARKGFAAAAGEPAALVRGGA